MKNLKVRTKLNLILTLVILLVVLASAVSINNMNQVKDKALETIDASSRQSYDDSIKQQVNVVISLLSEVYDEYKAGAYTLDEAKKIAADEVRQMRYGDAGYFWIDQSDGTNVVLLGSDTEGTNRMETQDAEGYQMVKEIIRVAVEDGGGYTDYVFPKVGETEPSPKRSYSEYFEPFDWVVGTGNYIDYIDTAIAAQDEKFSSYAVKKATTMIVACVAMLIIVAILIAMISRDITKSLKKIKDQFDIIAVGNFARKMQKPMLKRKDDFGQLANELEKMRESVRGLLAQVKIEAANIDTVVESIDSHVFNLNGEIEDVSATTEQLAASTQETAASAEQINGMTQQIEEAAREIAIRAQDGATEAEEIHQRATQTANRISEPSAFACDAVFFREARKRAVRTAFRRPNHPIAGGVFQERDECRRHLTARSALSSHLSRCVCREDTGADQGGACHAVRRASTRRYGRIQSSAPYAASKSNGCEYQVFPCLPPERARPAL